MCSCNTCPINLGANWKKSLPHKTGALSSSFFLFGWLGCHSNRLGKLPQDSPSSRGSEPTVTPQPSLSWLLRPRKHSFYGPSPSSLQPLVAVSWQELLIVFLLYVPSSVVQGWTGMTFLSCSKDLPTWNPQFGGHEDFLVVSTKIPPALCS
jgi:hypothetical protein